MDYGKRQENPFAIYTSVSSDDEEDAPPPKQPKRIFCSRLTVITIGRQQAEEEVKQDIHHPTTTDFNLNGPVKSPNQ